MARKQKNVVQVHAPLRTHYNGERTVDNPIKHPNPKEPAIKPDMSLHNSFPSFIKVRGQ